jgi:hypothetical protein
MKNKLRLAITISVLFIFTVTNFGQSLVAPKSEVFCPNAPDVRLNSAQAKLLIIEREISNIENTRVYYGSQADSLVQTMNQYSDDMTIAFEETLKAVERVARVNSAEGDPEIAQFENFEKIALQHQERVTVIQERLDYIEKAVHNGLILTIENPDSKLTGSIFLQQTNPLPEQDGNANILDPLSAQRVAIPCISPCRNKNWPACTACVVPIGIQLIPKINELNSCWNGCNGRRWWQRAGCKAACLVTFVAWIA